MTEAQEAEVDAFILASSNLRPTSRGYKALQILFKHGNLLYCYLGKWDTLDLAKVLVHLKFSYEHVSGGLQLRENSRSDFYHNVMYPKKQELKLNYSPNKYNRVGKEERDENKIGWAERKFK